MPTRLYGKQRVNANKQKKAAKGKENKPLCCMPHCENEASITKAPCGHNLCEPCLLQLMKCVMELTIIVMARVIMVHISSMKT